MINLGLHGGCIGGIFITGIFGNFYTKRGEFLTFKTGIPGGLALVAVAGRDGQGWRKPRFLQNFFFTF